MKMGIIENLEERYNIVAFNFHEILKSLEEKYIVHRDNVNSIPKDVVIPDDNYVRSLLERLPRLKGKLGSMEYNHCETKLHDLLCNGDFEDGEEIMSSIHEMINKYIYGSDTKVSIEDWKYIQEYISEAGYIAIPVKVGDDVTLYQSYFSRPIPATGGKPNTIKQIQLQPYKLKYFNGDEIVDGMKLCGKCTYYGRPKGVI